MGVEVNKQKFTKNVMVLDFNNPEPVIQESKREQVIQKGTVNYTIDEPDEENPQEEVIVVEEGEEEPAPTTVVSQEPQESTETPEEPIKKKRISSKFSSKIRSAKNEVQAYKNAAYKLLEENKALKGDVVIKDNAAALLRENLLKTRSKMAQQAIIQAREDGNYEQELEAQRQYNQCENEILQIKNRDQNIYQEEPDDISRYLNYNTQNYGEPELNSDQEDWLNENDWYDASSPNYDPELAKEAELYNAQLIKKYKLQRRSGEIGTKNHLDEISSYIHNKYVGSNYIQDEYEDEGEEMEEALPPPKPKPRQTVAPVNRASSQSANTNQSASTKRIHLTPDQRDFALRMEYGHYMTPQEKIKAYADAMMKRKKGN